MLRDEEDEEDQQEEIAKQYRDLVSLSDDDRVVMGGMLQLIRIGEEVGTVHDSFIDGAVTGYEALVRIDILLGLIEEVRAEVKSRL